MKILSNKKYRELVLKSCKGMFGAVTDDMLLKSNAFLEKEKQELQQELQRKDNIIKDIKEELIDDNKFELFYADDNIGSVMTLGAKYYREYLLDKIKELENENK